MRRCLNAKLSERFVSLKTEVTRLTVIASKFDTSMQLINLKLLLKFHRAKTNHSRVISKSLNIRTHGGGQGGGAGGDHGPSTIFTPSL